MPPQGPGQVPLRAEAPEGSHLVRNGAEVSQERGRGSAAAAARAGAGEGGDGARGSKQPLQLLHFLYSLKSPCKR